MSPPNSSLPTQEREENALSDNGERLNTVEEEANAHLSPAPFPRTRLELNRQVWNLAWPSVLTMLLQTINSLMDALFVGHLPNAAEALAATGVGGGIIFLLVSLAMGISVGTTALVARFTGARDEASAIEAVGQSLSLSAMLGLVFGIVAYFSRDLLVNLLLNSTKNPLAAQLCSQFLGMALLASLPLFILNVLQSSFRGIGDTRTPLLLTLAMVGLHIGLNFLLIEGRFGFPSMGVRGAGTAFALSNFWGCLLFGLALRRSPLAHAYRIENLRPQLEWVQRILKIGIPASIQAIMRTLSMMAFTALIARTVEGAAGVAALQIGIRTEAFAFMPGFGYSVAASALVGQSLGARDPEHAERCGWAALGQSLIVMVVMGVIFYLFAPGIAAIFTSNLHVRQLGVDYLRINAFSEPFIALGMVLTGALQGAGDTVRPTYITLISMWVIRMPLAIWLMFGLHQNSQGAWISMCVTTIVGGLMTLWLYKQGAWKKVKV